MQRVRVYVCKIIKNEHKGNQNAELFCLNCAEFAYSSIPWVVANILHESDKPEKDLKLRMK